jgi:hypothetical protein
MLVLTFHKRWGSYKSASVLVKDTLYYVKQWSSHISNKPLSPSTNTDYIIVYGLDGEDFLDYIEHYKSVKWNRLSFINTVLSLSKSRSKDKYKSVDAIVNYLISKGHTLITHGSPDYEAKVGRFL